MQKSFESLLGYIGHLDHRTIDKKITYKLHSEQVAAGEPTSGRIIGSNGDFVYAYSHTEEQALFIRRIFQRIDTLVDYDFQEVPSESEADITIYRAWHNSYWDKIGLIKDPLRSRGGGTAHYKPQGADVVWRDYYSNDEFNPSEKGTIVHEIGHALGLGHPDGEGSNPEWNKRDSIMSYNHETGSTERQNWFSSLDINTLQYYLGVEDDGPVEGSILNYIASHPDLITGIGLDPQAAKTHYLTHGIYEGRAFDAFDEVHYLTRNSDLTLAFGTDTKAALTHYIEFGYFEGRDAGVMNTSVEPTINR